MWVVVHFCTFLLIFVLGLAKSVFGLYVPSRVTLNLVVGITATDWLKILVSKMTCHLNYMLRVGPCNSLIQRGIGPELCG